MAPAQLRVRLLGPPDFRLGEHPLPVASARVRSLLAFLLLRRDIPHARQSLAFLLWPDSTESQALTNLRHLLHTIRGSLPEIGACLEVTARTVR